MAGGGNDVFHLKPDEARLAKAMLERGDSRFDIAYWFGVPEEEIEQLVSGAIYRETDLALPEELPEPGPYKPIQAVYSALTAVQRALELLNAARAMVGLPQKNFSLPTVVVGDPPGATDSRHGEYLKPSPPPQRKPLEPKYQPPGRKPPQKNAIRQTNAPPDRERDRASPIHLRLLLERGGFCKVTFLPRRIQGMPSELEATADNQSILLKELQEEWFEDVQPDDLGNIMRNGIAFEAVGPENRTFRWVLSGREIYVLGHRSDLSGFVSTSKISIGAPHIILCTPDWLTEVQRVIAETGSPEPILLHEDAGLPTGWIALQGVTPQKPIPCNAETDILNVLRPDADIEIVLEGGIRISRSAWLHGFPPRIRIQGDLTSISDVYVDGEEATLIPPNSFHADGWDNLGDHSIACGSMSRTYSIVEGLERWEPWDAYSWSLGEFNTDSNETHPSICGVLTRGPGSAASASRVLIVPATNSLLIGAAPGEIYRSHLRADISASKIVGLPPFAAVWAAPADILHCNKQDNRILFVGDRNHLPKLKPQLHTIGSDARLHARSEHARHIAAWCAAILNVGRKGLQIGSSDEAILALWQAYKQSAKAIRRSLR